MTAMSLIKKKKTDILVVGCGAAGMAAASAAAASGAGVIVIDDRDLPGGILQQCTHSGFGLGRYGKEGELNAGAIFLGSEEASYVTGVILPIDGGYTAV